MKQEPLPVNEAVVKALLTAINCGQIRPEFLVWLRRHRLVRDTPSGDLLVDRLPRLRASPREVDECLQEALVGARWPLVLELLS